MSSTEELFKKLAVLMQKQTEVMQQQTETMGQERQESKLREQRLEALVEATLNKGPSDEGRENTNKKIPTNATPAPLLQHSASLREFAIWKQKFKDYCLLTGINKASNDRQKAVLRSLLDDEWFRITKFALSIDMAEETTTIEAVINKMQEHFRSQRYVVRP